jgi:uncharacterized protein YciI
MYYTLTYEPVVENYVEQRKPYREAHLALARQWHAEGKLVMAGAFNPAIGTLLVFRAESPAEVELFVKADPYVKNGLVKGWEIREWTVVIGG